MDDREFDRFSKHLFTAYPDVWEWLTSNSPDVNGTLDVWKRTLSVCELTECLHVLDDWITGKRPVFKAYERSQIALIVRQAVMFDRGKEASRNRTDAASEEYRKVRREDYKPLAQNLPQLGMIFREGKQLREDLLDGKITQQEHDRRKQELIDSVR